MQSDNAGGVDDGCDADDDATYFCRHILNCLCFDSVCSGSTRTKFHKQGIQVQKMRNKVLVTDALFCEGCSIRTTARMCSAHGCHPAASRASVFVSWRPSRASFALRRCTSRVVRLQCSGQAKHVGFCGRDSLHAAPSLTELRATSSEAIGIGPLCKHSQVLQNFLLWLPCLLAAGRHVRWNSAVFSLVLNVLFHLFSFSWQGSG